MQTCRHECMHTYIPTRVYMRACLHTYMHLRCTHACAYIHSHAHIFTYMCHIQTCTHASIYPSIHHPSIQPASHPSIYPSTLPSVHDFVAHICDVPVVCSMHLLVFAFPIMLICRLWKASAIEACSPHSWPCLQAHMDGNVTTAAYVRDLPIGGRLLLIS